MHQSKIKICARIQSFQKNKNLSLTIPQKVTREIQRVILPPSQSTSPSPYRAGGDNHAQHKRQLGICAGLQSFQKKQKKLVVNSQKITREIQRVFFHPSQNTSPSPYRIEDNDKYSNKWSQSVFQLLLKQRGK